MRHILLMAYAGFLERYRQLLMLSGFTMKWLLIPGVNRLRTFNGTVRAYAEFYKAARRVPAYQEFLKQHNFIKPSFRGLVPDLSEIPSTDKKNYVQAYSIAARCVHGKIPESGVVIDESSGSCGTATNWVRGQSERKTNARFIKLGAQSLFGTGPLFMINAFALGPWATGINVTMSCLPFSRLKSLGPDKVKIENTLLQFGRDQKYVIMGYPPFLKLLVDESVIDWKQYHVSFIMGGESMSEGMRDYLIGKGIRKIYSSFGASDLELNISSENDFTISLRKLLQTHSLLRERILQHTGALPMIFQFNPTDFYIETSAAGDLIFTVCRPGYLAPKIRYNIHDKGHVMQLPELYIILKELNIPVSTLQKPLTDLPILFHYGRSDQTVSFFGATITPVDINEALFNLPELAELVHTFCISTPEDSDGNKQLVVSLEIKKDPNKSLEEKIIKPIFFEQLAKVNQDFREAKKMCFDNQIILRLHALGCGPFILQDFKIKASYIKQ